MEDNLKADRNRTSLAAELFVAAELTKQRHLVTITFGKEKSVDLLVAHRDDNRVTCSIDVKGLKKKNPWALGNYAKRKHPSCYIFCLLGEQNVYPKYYVVPKIKVDELVEVDSNGKSYWMAFDKVFSYENCWDLLWEKYDSK